MTVADLAQGIAAARAGRHAEARAALLKALEADDRNESAWLWLSGVMATAAERRICLENVLAINPANDHARRGLALLEAQPPQAPAAPVAAPNPRPLTAAPPALWLPGPPATGATIALSPEALPPHARGPQQGAPAAPYTMPSTPIEEMEDEEPCPYCGAATPLRERSCRACRKSLMVRRQPRDKRSVALSLLAGLWALSSLSALAGGVLLIIPLVMLSLQARSLGLDMPLVPLAAIIVGVLVSVALCVMTTLGLFRRQRWAYITHWATLALGLLMTALSVVFISVIGADALGAELGGDAAEQLAAAGSLGGVLLCNLVIYGAYITLSVLSHRDFYGEMARLSIDGISTGEEPYNAGIMYRNRGMWYMAAHAWERAIHQSPMDATARRALGLAYAQLKRYDEARAALREAIALAPNNPQLTDDLGLVERLATQAARKASPRARRAPQR
jgi:Flp pilus assembly protein TadD